MGKVSGDPRVYLKEALEYARQVLKPIGGDAIAKLLALKVEALDEALRHGDYKLVRRAGRAR